MMKLLPIYLFLFHLTIGLNAQSIGKTVVSSGGMALYGYGIAIGFTIGEPIVGPISNGTSLDQGFWAGSLYVAAIVPEKDLGGIKVYPNPVDNVLTVFTNDKEILGMALFAINGQRVLIQKVDTQQLHHEIDLSYINKGTYVLQFYVLGEHKEKLFKIIKN
ncbi:T9SS type A sorting domain-containing protein [Pricia sp.]|uniref:T9SS type A sorting domain-containing protein n=1 Tax=Pricia sp. TaxID=2268138 RepID=UPI003593D4AD